MNPLATHAILNVRFTLTKAAVVINDNTWLFTFDDRDSGLSLPLLKEKYRDTPNALVAQFDLVSVTHRQDGKPYRPFNIVASCGESLAVLDEAAKKDLCTAVLYRMRSEMEMFLRQLHFRTCDPQITTARMLTLDGKEIVKIPHSFFFTNLFTPRIANVS